MVEEGRVSLPELGALENPHQSASSALVMKTL
jgi:hypothetical protein